ncbi:MAG: hypothetical protein JO082_00450 [Mycobacterium sp.]|nr:hypothetical protein [Mycobacterium sp.]
MAAGDPFAYGVPVCSDSGQFDTSGCPILIARVVFRGSAAGGSGYDDVYELSLDGQWYCNDLCAGNALRGALPGTWYDPTAYVSIQNDNAVATVNYMATSSPVQLSLSEDGWDYAAIAGDTIPPEWPGEGRAFGYWDSYNGVDRVIYLGTPPNDHAIYEVSRKQNQSWAVANLSTNDRSEAAAPPAGSTPFGYLYDGVPRVIYTGTDSNVYELHPQPFWEWNNLLEAAGGAPKAVSAPYAYAPDIARVIYTDAAGQIIELSLESSGWKWNNLSTNNKSQSPAPAAVSSPFGYATGDNALRVIYRGNNGHIYELHSDKATNYFWAWADLSTIAEATSPPQVAAGAPFGYEIGDNIPRVVYRGTSGHICELALY